MSHETKVPESVAGSSGDEGKELRGAGSSGGEGKEHRAAGIDLLSFNLLSFNLVKFPSSHPYTI